MALGFYFWNRIRWRGFACDEEKHGELTRSHGARPPTERGRVLAERYSLERLFPLTRLTLTESLGVLDVLDRLEPREQSLVAPKGRVVRALDVGSKSWRYLPGLAAWLCARAGSGASLVVTGVEIDAFRPYQNLTTGFRCGTVLADRCQRLLAQSFRYLPGDVRMIPPPQRPDERMDCITWFFPFVFSAQHRAWGLPSRFFDAVETFRHVRDLLKPGGCLLTTHPTQAEWCEALRLLDALGLRPVRSLEIQGSLHPSDSSIWLGQWERVS